MDAIRYVVRYIRIAVIYKLIIGEIRSCPRIAYPLNRITIIATLLQIIL